MTINFSRPTISDIVKRGLCTGCGTCEALCPNAAIKLLEDEDKGIYVPYLNKRQCTNCGVCTKVCPGHSVNFRFINRRIFKVEAKNPFIGHFINCYLGYAKQYSIRYNSASGGLITALLIFCIKARIIDGVLVTKMSLENPLKPQVFVAVDEHEVLKAAKSKYCPVPLNASLKSLESKEGKYGMVGLPCHIHGIRKAELIDSEVRRKLRLHLGLFCSHCISFLGTKYLLQRINVKEEEVAELDYRGRGWPGSMIIRLKSGVKKVIPYSQYWGLGFNLFIPPRCLLCPDQTNELADLSFGDAWLPEVLGADRIGTSIVISRSEEGERLLERASVNGYIVLKKISAAEVIRSQWRALLRKKREIAAQNFIFKVLGKNIPFYDLVYPKPRPRAYRKATIRYVLSSILKNRSLWRLIYGYALWQSKVPLFSSR